MESALLLDMLLQGRSSPSIKSGYSLLNNDYSWVGFAFYFVNANGAQWRLPLAVQAIPALFCTIGILFLPESPRWRMHRHFHETFAIALADRM